MVRSVVFDNAGTTNFSKKRHGRPPATKLESVGVRANIDSIKCALSARLSLASAFQPSWVVTYKIIFLHFRYHSINSRVDTSDTDLTKQKVILHEIDDIRGIIVS